MNRRSVLLVGGIAILIAGLIGFLNWVGSRNHAESGDMRYEYRNSVVAPDFSLPDLDGNMVTLKNLKGKTVVLFFTGGLACYPCLEQIGELGRDRRLNSSDVVAFSVVAERAEDWQKARREIASLADARVLMDTEASVFKVYGALNLSADMQRGHAEHTYFIIDREGLVRFTLDDKYMGVRNELLLAEIKGLR